MLNLQGGGGLTLCRIGTKWVAVLPASAVQELIATGLRVDDGADYQGWARPIRGKGRATSLAKSLIADISYLYLGLYHHFQALSPLLFKALLPPKGVCLSAHQPKRGKARCLIRFFNGLTGHIKPTTTAATMPKAKIVAPVTQPFVSCICLASTQSPEISF